MEFTGQKYESNYFHHVKVAQNKQSNFKTNYGAIFVNNIISRYRYPVA